MKKEITIKVYYYENEEGEKVIDEKLMIDEFMAEIGKLSQS